MAEISELTTAVRVAWAKALEDPSCSCPVVFEPKALCEEIGAKISFEGIERVVLSFNRFDEVGLVPSKMTWNPEDIPGYLAGILHNKCVAVVEQTALNAVRRALEGMVVDTHLGKVTILDRKARLAGMQFQIKLGLG